MLKRNSGLRNRLSSRIIVHYCILYFDNSLYSSENERATLCFFCDARRDERRQRENTNDFSRETTYKPRGIGYV